MIPDIELEDIELGVERYDVYLDGDILKLDLTPEDKSDNNQEVNKETSRKNI